MTQGTGMAMVLATFPSEERGKAIGSFITVVGAGNVAGPCAGRVHCGDAGLAVGCSTLACYCRCSRLWRCLMVLDGRIYSRRGVGSLSFDWLGAALSTGALVTFLMVMTNAPRLGWLYPPVLVGIVALVTFVALFIWWELRCETPMIDVRLFRMRLISLGVCCAVHLVHRQLVHALPAAVLHAGLRWGIRRSRSGLIFVPASIAMIVTGPISGRLSDRFGYRWFTVCGLLFAVSGLLLLSTLTTESSVLKVAVGMLLLTGGTGTFYPPNNASIMQQVPESRYGVMSGFINLVRNSANITGTAVATAIVAAVMVSMGFLPNLSAVGDTGGADLLTAFVAGLRTAYIIVAGLLLCVGVVFSYIRPAAATV